LAWPAKDIGPPSASGNELLDWPSAKVNFPSKTHMTAQKLKKKA